jgi:hypothetical protein
MIGCPNTSPSPSGFWRFGTIELQYISLGRRRSGKKSQTSSHPSIASAAWMVAMPGLIVMQAAAREPERIESILALSACVVGLPHLPRHTFVSSIAPRLWKSGSAVQFLPLAAGYS